MSLVKGLCMYNRLSNFNSRQKSLIVIFYDFVIAYASFFLALILRYGDYSSIRYSTDDLLIITAAIAGFQSVIFYGMGLYKGIWRFSSTPDLIRIIKSVSIACLVVNFTLFQVMRFENFPRSIFFIDWLLLIVFLGGGRFAYRLIKDGSSHFYKNSSKDTELVLIVGAGRSGVRLLRDIRNNNDLGYRVVGFLDDNLALRGRFLQDVPVLGTTNDMLEVVKKTMVKKVFIAIPSATSNEIKLIIEKGKDSDIVFKTLPKLGDFIEGKTQLSQLRSISIEDLLGRESVRLDTQLISEMLNKKVVFVTGAGGSIGSELCAQIAKFAPRKLVCFEQSEFNLYQLEKELSAAFPQLEIIPVIGDVRNRQKVEKTLELFRPNILLHAAAYKHVPIMEINPYEAINTNVHGTRVVAESAVKFGIEKFVLVSTDKAVNPTNIMGTSKRVAEIISNIIASKGAKTKFITVRFGNVLGSSGSVIPLFQKQIETGGPITVTHKEVTRYFMSIPEASQLVLEAASLGKGGEIFVLDMGRPVKIYDLAVQMISLAGLKLDEDIRIEVCGLRPGEKLYEELLSDEESTLKTSHPKVLIAKSREIESTMEEKILELIDFDSSTVLEKYKEKLREIVPEYVEPKSHLKQVLEFEAKSNSNVGQKVH